MAFDADYLDRQRTLQELAGEANCPIAEIVHAIESGKLKHLCEDDVTVSLREWADYCRSEANGGKQ